MPAFKRKLIAIDMDGTLLAEDYSLSPFSIEFLSSLSKQGHVIVLSSGRPPRSMMETYAELSCSGPLICYNGAHVFAPSDPSFPVLKQAFPRAEAASVCKDLSLLLLGYQAEGERKIFRCNTGHELDAFFPEEGMEVKDGGLGSEGEDLYSVVFKEKIRNDDAFRLILSHYPALSWRHWTGSPFSELHLPSVSKGNALSFVMEALGIAKEDCFAFGDSDNDFEMLSRVGHPFAMRNSKSTRLLSSFQRTEKGNSEDGVAFELTKYF